MHLKSIFKIILAIIIGLLLSAYVAQHNAEFKKFAEKQCQNMAQKLFKLNMQPSIDELKLFWPSLNFKNISISKNNCADWHFEAENFETDFSWLELFINQKLQLNSHIDRLNIFTTVSEGAPTIVTHLKELLLNPKFIVPVNLKNFVVKDCSIQCLDQASGSMGFIRTNADLKESTDYFKSHLFFKDGELNLNQFSFLKKLYGNLHIEIPRKNVPTIVNADLSFQIPTSVPKDCFLSGKFYNHQGDFYLRSLDDELIITPITISKNKDKVDFTAQGQMPVSYLENLFSGVSVLNMQGDCNFSIIANIGKNQAIHGHMQVKDLFINSLKAKIDEAKFFFKRKNQLCKYNFILSTQNRLEITGSLTWNEKTRHGTIKLNNPEEIWVQNNKFPKNGLDISLEFSNSDLWGTYKCNMFINRKETELKGSIAANKKVLKVSGICGETNTLIEVGLKPKLFLKRIIFNNTKEKPVDLKTVESEDSKEIVANIEFSEARKLLPETIANQLSGKALIKLSGKLKDEVFTGKIETKNSNLIILNSYNIIKNLEANITFNIKDKTANLYNIQIKLEKGSICIEKTKVELDRQNNINFIHAPIIFNNCFLFWNNIFCTVSGKLLIQKSEGLGKITGKIVLENSKIQSNIFSSDFGPSAFNSNTLDKWKTHITIKSKNPIKVKTSILDCLAKLDIQILDKLTKPDLKGQIEILEGSIFLPYKALKITKGNILFIQGSGLDPTVELTAKAKIRSYLITMLVTGNASNAQIKLDSVPDLTEEQIGCLLLAGSENASLNLIVPTLIMQNLKNVIFGNKQIQAKIEKYYKAILKPFKHIRLAPTFVDETGRGGFRGAIEIDVSDRLHALIQKNFSMPEDTKFEVDYQITDDVSLRAIKDERGDLGGELEMRWKF